MEHDYDKAADQIRSRRSFLGTALGVWAITPLIPFTMQLAPGAGSLTKEERDSMAPAQVIEELKKGNI